MLVQWTIFCGPLLFVVKKLFEIFGVEKLYEIFAGFEVRVAKFIFFMKGWNIEYIKKVTHVLP